jgi:hypothetical protein
LAPDFTFSLLNSETHSILQDFQAPPTTRLASGLIHT